MGRAVALVVFVASLRSSSGYNNDGSFYYTFNHSWSFNYSYSGYPNAYPSGSNNVVFLSGSNSAGYPSASGSNNVGYPSASGSNNAGFPSGSNNAGYSSENNNNGYPSGSNNLEGPLVCPRTQETAAGGPNLSRSKRSPESPRFEELKPQGLRIRIPVPHGWRGSGHSLKINININKELPRIDPRDTKPVFSQYYRDIPASSGAQWIYDFPEIVLNPKDVIYYAVQVKEERPNGGYKYQQYHGYHQFPYVQFGPNGPQNTNMFVAPGIILTSTIPPRPEYIVHPVPPRPPVADFQPAPQRPVASANDIASSGLSQTTYKNGKPMCKRDFIPFPRQGKLSEELGGAHPDDRFTTFLRTSVTSNGTANIYTPSLLEEVGGSLNGPITLDNCTARDPKFCSAETTGDELLPPVVSGRESSEDSLTFRYGIMQIVAKMPRGDWLVPELWLLPKTKSYGNKSGKIILGMSRGNAQLTDGTQDYSGKVLEMGVKYGDKEQIFRKYNKGLWSDDFHLYQMIWTPDEILFLVDNEELGRVQAGPNGLDPELKRFGGTKMAPFDKEFYLVAGVHAGGSEDFPDSLQGKPWRNNDAGDRLQFWQANDKWKPTWGSDSSLVVASVGLAAL